MFAEYGSALAFLAVSAYRWASESFGLPRRLPRALAAFRAADVRALMISRSCWATAAKMWTVNLFACGLSTATNSTPESIRVAMNAKLAAYRFDGERDLALERFVRA